MADNENSLGFTAAPSTTYEHYEADTEPWRITDLVRTESKEWLGGWLPHVESIGCELHPHYDKHLKRITSHPTSSTVFVFGTSEGTNHYYRDGCARKVYRTLPDFARDAIQTSVTVPLNVAYTTSVMAFTPERPRLEFDRQRLSGMGTVDADQKFLQFFEDLKPKKSTKAKALISTWLGGSKKKDSSSGSRS